MGIPQRTSTARGIMKRWFDCHLRSGNIWEWDTDTQKGRWVSHRNGRVTNPRSDLTLGDFAHDDEVFPKWSIPRELRLSEGL